MKKQIKEDYNNNTATGFAWDFLQVKVTVNLSSYGVHPGKQLSTKIYSA